MAFEKISNSINDINQNIQNYMHSNSEYYKLKAFKNGMKGATSLVRFFILSFTLVLGMIFFSFAVAIALSQWIGVASAGYFIVGGLYFILCVVFYIFSRDPIEKFVIRKFSKIIFNEED